MPTNCWMRRLYGLGTEFHTTQESGASNPEARSGIEADRHERNNSWQSDQVYHKKGNRSMYGSTRRCEFLVGELDDIGVSTGGHKGRVAKIEPGGGGSGAPKVENKIVDVGWEVGYSSL